MHSLVSFHTDAYTILLYKNAVVESIVNQLSFEVMSPDIHECNILIPA